MLHLRLIFGLTIAVAIIGLMVLDAWLSVAVAAPRAAEFGSYDPLAWLCNGAITTGILVIFTWFAAREVIRMARSLGYQPFGTISQIFAVGLVFGPWISFNLPRTHPLHDQSLGMLGLSLALAVAFFMQATRWHTEKAIINVATTLFVIFYTGALAGYLVKLRMELGAVSGVVAVLYSVFIVKMTDTGAYFIGRLTGRHKLIEWLSPKKTWEGFVGGLATAVLMAYLVGLGLHAAQIPPFGGPDARSGLWPLGGPLTLGGFATLGGFGLVLGLFSVAGDLSASLIKRDAAVKDSGVAVPGLGGVIDMLDSPLLTAPLAWFFWTRLAWI